MIDDAREFWVLLVFTALAVATVLMITMLAGCADPQRWQQGRNW